MKNWNRTGKIKAIILGLCSLPNLILPIPGNNEIGYAWIILTPLLFGCIGIPLIIRMNKPFSQKNIHKPSWNDSLLKNFNSITFLHFGGYFMLVVGLSIIIGSAFKFHILHHFGLSSISFGVGILIGIRLALKWINPNMKK